jgi:hypothetical protein
MAENDGFYYCDCPRHCKKRKKVSCATWYGHAKHRDTVTKTFSAFEEELAGPSKSATAGQPVAEQPQLHTRPISRPPQIQRQPNKPDEHDSGKVLDENEVSLVCPDITSVILISL